MVIKMAEIEINFTDVEIDRDWDDQSLYNCLQKMNSNGGGITDLEDALTILVNRINELQDEINKLKGDKDGSQHS